MAAQSSIAGTTPITSKVGRVRFLIVLMLFVVPWSTMRTGPHLDRRPGPVQGARPHPRADGLCLLRFRLVLRGRARSRAAGCSTALARKSSTSGASLSGRSSLCFRAPSAFSDGRGGRHGPVHPASSGRLGGSALVSRPTAASLRPGFQPMSAARLRPSSTRRSTSRPPCSRPIMGWLVYAFGWPSVFYFMGAVGILVSLRLAQDRSTARRSIRA